MLVEKSSESDNKTRDNNKFWLYLELHLAPLQPALN